MKVNLTVDFEFDFNSETKEFTLVKQTIVKEGKKESKSTTTTSKVIANDVALVVREDNKLVFNQLALEMIGVEAGDTVAIQFDKKGKVIIPIIGKDDILGVKGNKITKTGTLSCRGKTNEVLTDYGTNFTLKASSKKGIFELIGDKESNSEVSNEADEETIVNDNVLNDDIDFDMEIDIEGDDKNLEITDFTFN